MDVASLLEFEQHLREAYDLAQLSHTIVNQAHNCLAYTQAVLLDGERPKGLEPIAASDIPTVDFTAPFFTWIERLAKHLSDQPEQSPRNYIVTDVPEDLAQEWQEMAPGQLLWLPLRSSAGNDQGSMVLLLFRSKVWSEKELQLASHLSSSIGHALFALRRCSWSRKLWVTLNQRHIMLATLVLLIGLLWLPVRITALAPAEVIARDPQVITASIDGAVREVMVVPNQQVQPGETLVQLEDTELSADYEVAERALLVAKAELKTVQQSAFVDIAQKARLSEVEANVRLRQAEVDQARLRLAKTRILAPTRGIVVLGDPNEWKGKPVRVGERIMLLADQNSVELKIMLPVKDSIALQSDAHVRVYFDNDPLNARQGQVIQAGYEPQHTTDEQFAYRLVARLDEPTKAIPRIGLRGTAKVYGGKVRLFFYLFRRPITALRQQLGW
jgi:multidrug efflux pump subunit AcrA (membrane-fusion protein)